MCIHCGSHISYTAYTQNLEFGICAHTCHHEHDSALLWLKTVLIEHPFEAEAYSSQIKFSRFKICGPFHVVAY